jgi:hypothetical protein
LARLSGRRRPCCKRVTRDNILAQAYSLCWRAVSCLHLIDSLAKENHTYPRETLAGKLALDSRRYLELANLNFQLARGGETGREAPNGPWLGDVCIDEPGAGGV